VLSCAKTARCSELFKITLTLVDYTNRPGDVATQLLRGTVPEIGANLVSFYGERGAGDWSHLELDLPVSKRRIIRRNCRFLYMGLQKLKGFSFSMGGGGFDP